MPVLSQERLTRQLREGALGGVFLLLGDEDHLKDGMAREIIAAHLDPATRDFNLDDVRGPDVAPETLGSLIQTPPMMAEWRVVVVRDAQALAISATFRTMLDDVSGTPPPGLALLLLADVGTSTAKLWATLKKRAATVAFPRLSEADMPGWLMGWAERADIVLDIDAARGLAAAIGPNLAAAVQEMEKLREYVGDRARITRQDVIDAVGTIPRQDRWEWIDSVAERRFEQARAGLPILLDAGDSGVGLVIGLANQFLRLAVFRAGGQSALEAVLPQHQRWLARRVAGQARGWTDDGIDQVIHALRRADRLLKSAPLSDFQVMEELLLRMQHDRMAAA
jgi:DNA polymerase III subunit delta